MSKAAIKKAIGQRIKSLRGQKGLTIEKLAYENGLAKGNLSEIEKGKIDTRISTLERIAKGLEINLKELCDF